MQRTFSTDFQSLLLSIFIHGIIASVFIFSVPLQKIDERPMITFWGAFLSSIETPFPIAGINDKRVIAVQLVSDHQPIKPINLIMKSPLSYPAESLGTDKKIEKTTFLEKFPSRTDTDPQNQRYQKTKIQYQPLSLRPY